MATITGGDGSDLLFGGMDADLILAGGGHDTLTGAAATDVAGDTLVGGTGDDIYLVANPLDLLVEAENEGTDEVRTTLAAYTLGDHFERLTHDGSGAFTGTGNDLDNLITGGAGDDALAGGLGNDTLDGGAGADTLVGGTGADTLVGGAGNDVHLVDDAGDMVIEEAGEGIDEVRTALAALTLATGVEALTYTGTASFTGTGNDLGNTITAGAGADTLSGGTGADTLDGGLGADTLTGGSGDDVYRIDDADDVVVELAGEGTDEVRTSLATHTLGGEVEKLTYTGAGAFIGTGNALDNTITGGGGADTLTGLEGDDTLDGGGGADTLTGGHGDDTYVVDSAADQVVELPGEGTDTVRSAVSWTLQADFENLVLDGAAATGTGNAAGNTITGNAAANLLTGLEGDDTLDGGAGADTLVGGLGDDAYVVDSAADQVVEADGEGTDTVVSTVSWTLGAHLERLVLAGTGSTSGTGNALDNAITGNGANNTLDGGLGDDTLKGGLGNDVYIVDSLNDRVEEDPGQGTDEVRTALAAWTLGANLERLVFTGAGAFDGTGNELANTLTGQAGDDTLSGLGGNDTLTGGAGADTLDGGLGTDTASYATSTTGVAVDLAAGLGTAGDAAGDGLTGIENLTGGSGADTLTGDAGVNVLTGNAGADTLSGLDGNDTLIGGAGADVLDGGSGTDTASYATSGASVAVDLAAGGGMVGDAAGDTLTGIENLTGGNGADTLLGDGGANRIDGGTGNDTLQGRGGNDSLVGGSGTDTAVYLGSVRDYVATKSGTTWTIAAPAATGEGTDTLTGMEYAQFSDMLVHLDRNNAPVVPGGLTASTNEDAAPLSVNLLAGVWDFENDALSVTGLTQTIGSPVTVSLAGGVLTLGPAQLGFLAAGETADLTFDFGVSDGTDSTARSLTVTVAGRNDAPVVTGTLAVTTNEDAGPLPVDLLQGASDPDTSDTLSVANFVQTGGRAVAVTRVNGALTLDTAQFNDLGAGESETVTFGYNVGDGAASVAQTLAVTVEGRNDAPVAGADHVSLWKNTPRILTAGMLLANDDDPDSSDTLGLLSVGNAVNGSVTLDVDGRIVFTPTTGATGAASFTYMVGDGHGGTAQGNVLLTIQDQPPATDTPLSVNTVYSQYDPNTITLANGNTLAYWWSYNSADNQFHAMARRFDPSGTPIDATQEIDLGAITLPFNTYHVPMWDHMKATALPGGGFVLSYLAPGGGKTRVTLQRFDDNGVRLNPAGGTSNPVPIQVNTDSWNYVVMPRVAVLADGRYMAIWEGHDAANQGDIVAQIFNTDGTTASNQFLVNTTTLWHQMYPEVTQLADGGFIVAWNSGKADTGNTVAFQRFNGAGQRVGGETAVGGLSGTQEWPTVAALADGGWVVVWQRAVLGSSDFSIQAQVYNADGSTRGSGFTVNQGDAGAQVVPRVRATADGGFYVSWNSSGAARDAGIDLWGRRFDRQGTAITDEVRINQTTTGDQGLGSVASLGDGRLLAVFTGPDASYDGVYWRILGPHPLGGAVLEGTAGSDTLVGTGSADTLVGYAGNDTLIGGGGGDTLVGGSGTDSFRFTGQGDGPDTVIDFQPGPDRIEVVGTAFGGLPVGTLDAGRFALSAAADADDRFVFDTATRTLSYDADGTGATAAVPFAVLSVGTLTAGDIRVVAPV